MALVYVAGGWVGSFLAIPPGYSSAFWMPAGIALMALVIWGRAVWPGIVVGSFLINIFISAKAGGFQGPILPLAPLALGIALGATLQAVLGAALIRRYVSYPSEFAKPGEFLRFLGLGGPLACLVSATTGVALLAATRTIPAGNIPFAWFNWYVGDTLGVVIVAPLFLVLFGEPAAAWRARRLQVGLPVLLSLAGVLGAFLLMGRLEQWRMRAVFERKAEEVTHRIQTTLDDHLTILRLSQDHFRSTGALTRQGFRDFTQDVLARYHTLQALEWVPRVPGEARPGFEREVRGDGSGPFGNFRILERDPSGALVPAGSRAAYFPVLFLEPYAGNEKASGFDVGSEPRRRDALVRAVQTGEAAATQGVVLAQEKAKQVGVLVFVPMFRPGVPKDTAREREEALQGFMLGVFRVGDLVDKALANLDRSSFTFRITEAAGASQALYEGHPWDGARSRPPFATRTRLDLAGKAWDVAFEPSLPFLDANRSPLPWLVQAVGLLLAGLLGAIAVELTVHQETLAAREAQQAIAESQAQLEGIIQAATEFSIITTDLAGTIRVFSAGAERMLGYSAAELVGRATPALFHEKPELLALEQSFSREAGRPVQEVEALFKASLDCGPEGRETVFVRKDGGLVPVLLVVTPILDAEARTTGFLGIAKDFSERRKAERTLRESQKEYQTLFESLPVCLFVKEAAGLRYIRVNRVWEALQGCPRAAIIGKSDAEFFPPEEAARFTAEDRQAIRAGVPLDIPAGRVQSWHHGTRALHTIKVPVLDEEGNPRYILGISEDVTDRMRAEEDRALLEKKLHQSQKMESLGLLAGGVAHDMNNVLAAIMGLASAHLMIQEPESKAYRAFDTISQAADRGGKMVQRLLGFARQTPVDMRELDLNDLVREEVHLLERTTLSKVELQLDLDPGLRPIRGDASALAHSFMNIFVNSVDAMPEKGLLSIRTSNLGEDRVAVQVQDTGCGMPEEVLRKALDPFFTTKEVGKGTGLGLSMVYTTVKAHHGQVELRSEPGQGTLVTLTFPACASAFSGLQAGDARSPAPAGRSLQVLLVDDDELVQQATGGMLEVLGHGVTIASSGEEALDRVRDGLRPDLVILDMNMPGMGGAETLPRLRALCPGLPVLVATGRADQAALDLVGRHEAVTLMQKPFSTDDLRVRLAAMS